MKDDLKIKALPWADIVTYGHEGAISFDLKVHSFKKVFKGAEEIDLNRNLQRSVAKGEVTLRPFERMLVGTGLFVEVPKDKALVISSKPGLSLSHGIVVLDSPRFIGQNHKEEICVALYNSSQFLTRIKVGDRVAKASIMGVEQADILFENQHCNDG